MIRNVVMVRHAYQGYDRDIRRGELRAEPAPQAEQIARVQFELPG